MPLVDHFALCQAGTVALDTGGYFWIPTFSRGAPRALIPFCQKPGWKRVEGAMAARQR
jgi:hypothetical protein